MKFIMKYNLPFSIVDSEGFKEYTYSLNNKVNVKHSTTYSRFKLPLLHKHVKSLVNYKIFRDSLILEPILKIQEEATITKKSNIEIEFKVYKSITRPGTDSKQVDFLG